MHSANISLESGNEIETFKNKQTQVFFMTFDFLLSSIATLNNQNKNFSKGHSEMSIPLYKVTSLTKTLCLNP